MSLCLPSTNYDLNNISTVLSCNRHLIWIFWFRRTFLETTVFMPILDFFILLVTPLHYTHCEEELCLSVSYILRYILIYPFPFQTLAFSILGYINILKQTFIYSYCLLNNFLIMINSAFYHELIHWQQRFERKMFCILQYCFQFNID